MAPELRVLGWSILLGLVYVLAAATFATRQRGLKWNIGNRDGVPPPLSPAAARASRASRNFLETFPFFAAAALAVVAAGVNNSHTALGAQLYFWARVLYLPIYLIGIPWARTVAYGVSLWGLLQMLAALL